MYRYVLRRLLQMIPTLLLVTIGTFSLLLLVPGDPVTALLSGGQALDAETIRLTRHELGFDQPVPVQYANWLVRVVHGDLGKSTSTRQLVTREISSRLPATLQLGIAAWVFSLIIAIPAGIISAVHRNSKLDLLATIVSIGGIAIPSFWLGIIMILILGVTLNLLPPSGFVNVLDNPGEGIRYLIMPAFSLGVSMAALNMRQVRSAMLEILTQDYVRTARAKGLWERRIIWLHALKNALLPVVTLMGLQVGRIFAGAVVIEQVFAIPGLGRLAVSAIFLKDFPLVQGLVLLVAVAVLFANLITDLIYGLLDPRIRYS